MTVDTPRSQTLIGFLKGSGKTDSNFGADVSNGFCTMLLSSMDREPIASSAKLLLEAGGTVQNSGQVWNSARTDVTAFGGWPTLVDLVRRTMTLRGLRGARGVSVQAIHGAGQPLGRAVKAVAHGEDWAVTLGATTTTWYEISVTR